jgi:hypothetical protein
MAGLEPARAFYGDLKRSYVAVRNPYEGEGRWKIGKNSYVIYAKKTLSKRDQITARKCIEEIKSRYPQP